jgi:cytoskeletal protein CcmA (bactofilin family)
VVIGSNGSVDGDISGQQADIMGKVTGTIKVKELLQLKGGSQVNGNLYAGKLQIEPSANFNGQCHMNTAVNGVVTDALNDKKAEKLQKF